MSTCEHAPGELRGFIELRKDDAAWYALVFMVGGSTGHPEVHAEVEIPPEDGGDASAVWPLNVAAEHLAEAAMENDEILRERV